MEPEGVNDRASVEQDSEMRGVRRRELVRPQSSQFCGQRDNITATVYG